VTSVVRPLSQTESESASQALAPAQSQARAQAPATNGTSSATSNLAFGVAPNPSLRASGRTVHLDWAEGVTVRLDRLHEGANEPKAELMVRLTTSWAGIAPGDLVGPIRVNLTSMSRQEELRRALDRLVADPPVPWSVVVRTACARAVAHLRRPAPAERIGHVRQFQSKQRGYALSPIMRANVATVMYGEGGSGKSLLAIYFALLVQGGFNANGLLTTPGDVLYLDWETDQEDFENRVFALQEGDRRLEGVEILYRRCAQPFMADFEAIRRHVAEHQIDTVVVDSFEAALGANSNDADQVMPIFNGLRELGVTALLIDHKSKEDAGRDRSAGPIGSVMKLNRARSVWEVKMSDHSDGDTTTLGLFHRKVNSGRRQRPMGFDLSFSEDTDGALGRVKVARTDLAQVPDLENRLAVRERVRRYLLKRGAKTARELAEALGVKEQTVRNALNRGKGKDYEQLAGGRWGCRQHP
jgi:hypothetical protein